ARQLRSDLQQGQAAAHVAVGRDRDQVQLRVVDLQAATAEAALFVLKRVPQRGPDVVGRDRLHHVHAAAREQRRVQFERRVLGGRADEDDGAALDVRQEGVLLRLV